MKDALIFVLFLAENEKSLSSFRRRPASSFYPRGSFIWMLDQARHDEVRLNFYVMFETLFGSDLARSGFGYDRFYEFRKQPFQAVFRTGPAPEKNENFEDNNGAQTAEQRRHGIHQIT